MFKCIYCGFESKSAAAIFCGECGPNGPGGIWLPEDVDQPLKITQYITLLSEYIFDLDSNIDIEKTSMRIRDRLKISHAKHLEVLSKLSEQKKAIAHLSNFRFEFNENVTDAYAGHDTFLDFRYTNLSQDDAFKVSLIWDDSQTTDRIDLRTESKSFVKPMASLTFGASAVFDRIGIKEISDLQITITDQFGESASFRVEPFRFRVANHEQRITNNISTHNQISIEGRGVVDATGMGADKRDLQQSISIQPSWKELDFIYLPNANVHTLVEESTLITVSAADPKKFSSQAFGVPSALTVSKPSSRVMTALKASSSPHDIEVRIPDLGDFDEVQVIELLVKVGDKVKVDQSLITVENDKASMEIPSLHSGVLKDLNVKLGDKVREGSLIAKIENVDVVEVSENQLQQSISSNALYPLEVHIPDIGDVKDVVVLEILVKVGDIVHKDQSILMVESDKFTMEIPSTESGVVKELKVLLGDKVNEGTLVLLLDMQTGVKESSANDVKCPPINVYLPASRQYIKLTLVTEFLEIMRGVRSRSKNWHILVSGTKSVQKLMIRDLILEGGNFSELRSTSSGDLENVKDLAAILTNLEKNHLFELDGLDELVFRGGYFSDIISTSLADFQMDIMIGEGVSARAIKLDLQPFYSIFYCKDINVLPVNLLNHFSCCFTLDE